MKKLSTESYKGVRDFYPEQMWVRKWMFSKLRSVVEKYGFVEYDASILEPADLYTAKSGEEIVNEQTYTFEDRGGRKVTLRPEMTPTVARMIAAKRRELGFPIRWYSIPNLFRYEAPQRGRLREHFQLNVDIFGQPEIDADIETIVIGSDILKSFGARNEDFVIKINSRPLMNAVFDHFEINTEVRYQVSKILDKKDKLDFEIFKKSLTELLPERGEELAESLNTNKRILETLGEENEEVKNIIYCLDALIKKGVTNVIFAPSITRGFDYYTGIVFEFFDTDKENKRSLFGGGRFDSLTELFDNEKIPAVGFGMGDVTLKDFLESRNLIPEYVSETDLCIATIDKKYTEDAQAIATAMREAGVNVSWGGVKKSRGDVFKTAERNKIPFVLLYGDSEKENGTLTITHTWKKDISIQLPASSPEEAITFIESQR